MKKYAFSCLEPKLMLNPYNHQWFVSRCNHCSACTGERHNRYVRLMSDESKNFRYAYFVTLTYNDYFVPKLYFTSDRKFLYNTRDNICIPNLSESVEVDKHFVDKKKYIEYGRYSDVQKFFKRLRQWYLRNAPYEDFKVCKYGPYKENIETFRYFCALEYGPFTCRPHYHIILYFNSSWLAQNFGKVIPSCWSVFDRVTRRRTCIGSRSQYRATAGDADKYTASYCDAVAGLPKLYSQTEIKPRHSYSRKPSLGSSGWDMADYAQLLHTGALRIFDGKDKQGNPVVVQIPQSVVNQIFPKCPCFGSLTDRERAKCYNITRFIAERFKEQSLTYDKFVFYCYQDKRLLHRLLPFLDNYLSRNFHVATDENDPNVVQRPLYGLYLSSKRFNENLKKYDLSPFTYLQMINDFYSLRNYYQLHDFLENLEQVSKTESYKNFYSISCGVGEKFRKRYPLRESNSFRSLSTLSNELFRSRIKNKKERDYQLRGNAVVYEPEKYI